jgi:hypothetical protein
MAGKLDELLHAVRPPAKTPEPSEDEDLGAYVVYPKGAHALDIEDGGKPVVSLQYVYLGMQSQFTPEAFTFYFKDGDEKLRLTVTGRNLRDVYNRINDHCVRKIRKADRPYADDKQTIILSADVVLVEEPKGTT